MKNSKQAIELLKRCWEHRFNLEDYQCDELVELIQQQDKTIELAIEWIVDHAGDCPNGLFDWPNNCEVECGYGDVDEQMGKCWRKYLQSEVSK